MASRQSLRGLWQMPLKNENVFIPLLVIILAQFRHFPDFTFWIVGSNLRKIARDQYSSFLDQTGKTFSIFASVLCLRLR